jgi:hypothetical protein
LTGFAGLTGRVKKKVKLETGKMKGERWRSSYALRGSAGTR